MNQFPSPQKKITLYGNDETILGSFFFSNSRYEAVKMVRVLEPILLEKRIPD